MKTLPLLVSLLISTICYSQAYDTVTYYLKNAAHETFYASGNGGNKIMIFKDLDVVIIITATAYGQPYMHLQVDEIMEQYLLPSIIGK